MIRFDCDYLEGAHPAILQRLAETNMDQTLGYGEDPYCAAAAEKIRKACAAPDAAVHFLVGGTQTNTTVIYSILRPHEGVLAVSTGHINCHEVNAIEGTGHKVLAIPGENGKLTAPALPMEVLTELADFVLAEADGSRQLPLKAHAAHEPVIPENSRRVICVVGASGFGKPVRETVHRWERFCGLTGAAETEPVTPELAAKALLAEGRCDTMLLNQIDGADRRPAAERFAAELAGHGLRVWGGSLRLGSIFPL